MLGKVWRVTEAGVMKGFKGGWAKWFVCGAEGGVFWVSVRMGAVCVDARWASA